MSSLFLPYTRSISHHDLSLPSHHSLSVDITGCNPYTRQSLAAVQQYREPRTSTRRRARGGFSCHCMQFSYNDPFSRTSPDTLYRRILVYRFYTMIRCAIGIHTLDWSLIRLQYSFSATLPSFAPPSRRRLECR